MLYLANAHCLHSSAGFSAELDQELTRVAKVESLEDLWSHIVHLYLSNSGFGFSLIPKVKYEHIYLTSFSKMRVNFAAQISCMHMHIAI